MTKEKAEYSCVAIGPGGRNCSCCAQVPKLLKRYEHRKARRSEKKQIEFEMRNAENG